MAGHAAATDDYRAALAQAGRLALTADHLRQAILRDVLADGADCWQVADLLGTHPQHAYETGAGCNCLWPATAPRPRSSDPATPSAAIFSTSNRQVATSRMSARVRAALRFEGGCRTLDAGQHQWKES